MTGGLEAAGDAITGAILGRAVEPDHGEATTTGHGACLNCGTTLIGAHCHGCGQKAKVHRTLHEYAHDLLHGVFHFEGKVWRTLPMLAFKPGELTRRYIHGERAKFVSPLAMFLFAVFLMFAVVSSVFGEFHTPEVAVQDKGKTVQQLDAELKTEKAQMAALKQKMDALPAEDPQRDVIDKQIGKIDKKIDGLDLARDALTGNGWTFVGDSTDTKSFWGPLNLALQEASKNPDLLIYKLQSSAYKYSWALIPLSVPFVWLLFFWKRQFKMYDHAIFVTYSLAFMLFLVTVLTVMDYAGVGDPVVPLLGVFGPPLFTYRQLRGAYGVSRFGAIIRTFAIMMFGALVLSIFAILLLALGVLR